MVANELERVTVEYLTQVLETAAGKRAVLGPPVMVALPDIGEVRIYKGEANLDLLLPAVVAACNSTEHDQETWGNTTCQLVVGVKVQVDPETVHPEPLVDLNALSTLVFNAMFAHDLAARLNQFRGPDFTAIATINRSPVKTEQDRHGVQFLNCTLYCSGRDLL
jgi:hypothetical protein